MNISSRFGPPHVDLRQGRLADDYGYEENAKIPINHNSPMDVKDEELEYYSDVWPFLDPESKVFYLYAVTNWFVRNPNSENPLIYYYIWSLDRNWKEFLEKVSPDDTQKVLTVLTTIRDQYRETADIWEDCHEIFRQSSN